MFGERKRSSATLWQHARGWQRAQQLETALLDLIGQKPKGIVNRKLIRVLGMRRTGNHAIINWIMESIGGNTLLLNNLVTGKNGYRHRDIFPEFVRTPEYEKKVRQGRFRNFEKREALIVSFEDYFFDEFRADGENPRLADFYGPWEQRIDVLLLRDPYNLFASRIKSGKTLPKRRGSDQKQLFVDHAEVFLRERAGDRLICISYNEWHVDPAYRLGIQAKLGVTPHEVGHEKVSWQGQGSSFDGQGLKASEMSVLARWRAMEHHPAFVELFADGELERYCSKIFGDVRGARDDAPVEPVPRVIPHA